MEYLRRLYNAHRELIWACFVLALLMTLVFGPNFVLLPGLAGTGALIGIGLFSKD